MILEKLDIGCVEMKDAWCNAYTYVHKCRFCVDKCTPLYTGVHKCTPVDGTRYMVHGAHVQCTGTWYTVHGTPYMVHGTVLLCTLTHTCAHFCACMGTNVSMDEHECTYVNMNVHECTLKYT